MNIDTIAAVATALGDSSIGIIRISGDSAFDIVKKIFKPKNKENIFDYNERELVYGHLYDAGKVVDEVFAVYMKGPRTYTREDIVEINCHGGFVMLQNTLKLILASGARMAEPGEFTQRAFLNGRIDLVQAEAVMDMIQARSELGFDIAYKQHEGHLSRKVKDVRETLLALIAQIEVNIDYPDEDIEEITYTQIRSSLELAQSMVEKILEGSDSGKVIRDGVRVAIIGKPNVGKSSMLNTLLKDARAIVTDIPGTTRDIIEEHMNIKGVPIKLIDTAGIRDTQDIVEKIGVDRTKEVFNSADVIIAMFDGTLPLNDFDKDIMSKLDSRKAIVFVNKTDADVVLSSDDFKSLGLSSGVIFGSVMNEINIEQLEKAIYDLVLGKGFRANESSLVTNTRHISQLERAIEYSTSAITAVDLNMPLEFVAVDVKNTYDSLGSIVGETVEDDIVSNIFSKFCLGK